MSPTSNFNEDTDYQFGRVAPQFRRWIEAVGPLTPGFSLGNSGEIRGQTERFP